MAFHGLQWWSMALWGGKEDNRVNKLSSKGSSSKYISEYGYGYGYGYGFGVRETTESVKFPLKGAKVRWSSSSSTPRKVKKRWQSREERKIDREHDVVLVPNDGVNLSGSESEDSDWSIGWLEPHGPDFLSDDETDDSFAVLVPCYRNDKRDPVEFPNSQLLNAVQHLTNEHFTDGKNLVDHWLSSLQHF